MPIFISIRRSSACICIHTRIYIICIYICIYMECYMAYKISTWHASHIASIPDYWLRLLVIPEPPDPGCLAFPVTLTVLALQRVFGHREHLCPFWMHHALCNWPRLHGGSAGPLPELPISDAWRLKRRSFCVLCVLESGKSTRESNFAYWS